MFICMPIHIFVIGDSNNDWGKNFIREIIFCTLMTVTMKTALYEKKFTKTLNQRKLVRLIKSTISQSVFHTMEYKVL